MSLKGMLLFPSEFGFPIIRTGLALVIVIVSLVEFLEKLTFFLTSALSLFDSVKLSELPRQLWLPPYHVLWLPALERFEVYSFGEP